MGKNVAIGALLLIVCVLAFLILPKHQPVAVSSPAAAAPRPKFFGIPLPGNGADALAAGFASCNPDINTGSVDCTMKAEQLRGRTIFGASVTEASIHLTVRTENAGAAAPGDKMTYYALILTISKDAIPGVEAEMEKEGWIQTSGTSMSKHWNSRTEPYAIGSIALGALVVGSADVAYSNKMIDQAKSNALN